LSVSVPISKKDNFGFSRSQPDKKTDIPAVDFPSEVAFLRQLAIQGRLVHETGDAVNLEVVPPSGTTFFFLSGEASSENAGATDVGLDNDGVQIELLHVPPNGVAKFNTRMDSLVGDGIKIYRMNGAVNVRTSMLGWFENTEKA